MAHYKRNVGDPTDTTTLIGKQLLLAPALSSQPRMLLAATALVAVASALCLQATAVVVEFDPMPERPFTEPVFVGNIRETDSYSPRFRRSIDHPFILEDDIREFHKKRDPDYVYDYKYGLPSKRSIASDLMTFGEPEDMEDGHMPEKRMYVQRDGFRPSKRSMAIGRAGMRPGKRAFASVLRGKRGQMYPETYIPQNSFFYFDE